MYAELKLMALGTTRSDLGETNGVLHSVPTYDSYHEMPVKRNSYNVRIRRIMLLSINTRCQ